MKIRDIISEAKKAEAPKPRNFVAKHAKTAGAGAHKDKKKAAKQGDVKHKGKVMAEGSDDLRDSVSEVLKTIYKGASAGENMIDYLADEFGQYYSEVEASGDQSLQNAYSYMMDNGQEAEDDPQAMAKIAKQAFFILKQGVAEAGFVDVTGWSPSRVQAMGRADDDSIGSYTSRNKPNLIAWVFYNVKPGQEDQAATLNIRKLKSGKWAMPVYDKSGATYRFQRNKADQVFGPGKRWDIKNEQSTVAETATAGATSAANVSVGAVYKNKPGKTPKNKDGTAKNALDMKANLLTGGSIKR